MGGLGQVEDYQDQPHYDDYQDQLGDEEEDARILAKVILALSSLRTVSILMMIILMMIAMIQKQYQQNLPDDPAASPHLCVVDRCSDWNRLFKSSPSKKKKKTFSFFLVWCRLGWNILSSSSPSKSSWLKTLSISSLSIMSGSSLLEYNSLNLHPCRCHYDYQFQVLILIIVHA